VRDRTAAYQKYQDRLSQQLKNFVHVYVLVRQNLRSSIKSPLCTIFFSQGPLTLTLTQAHLHLSKPFSQSRSTCIYSNSSNPSFVRPPPRRRPVNGVIRTHTPSTHDLEDSGDGGEDHGSGKCAGGYSSSLALRNPV
jgi:hypothetical protein